MCIHRLRTNSNLVVPLLLALHSTTRAMTPAMAAVSNTPPMKPPVAAPATAPATAPVPAPAHAQSSTGIRGSVVHNGTHRSVHFDNKHTSISHYNEIFSLMQREAICLALKELCTQHWTNSWCMATTTNRGQCIRKRAWTEEALRKLIIVRSNTQVRTDTTDIQQCNCITVTVTFI